MCDYPRLFQFNSAVSPYLHNIYRYIEYNLIKIYLLSYISSMLFYRVYLFGIECVTRVFHKVLLIKSIDCLCIGLPIIYNLVQKSIFEFSEICLDC